jgi:hypothetical protein
MGHVLLPLPAHLSCKYGLLLLLLAVHVLL